MTTTTPEPHTQMDRFDKMEFLRETTHWTDKNQILEELVMFLDEDTFSKFYDHFCSCWDICRSHEELNERYGS